MINRRGFFKALGGAAVVAFTHTVTLPTPIVPAPPVEPLVAVPDMGWINMANAIAFSIHAHAVPEHGSYYRARAIEAMRKVRR